MPLYQRKKRRSSLPDKNGGDGELSNVMYLGNIPHGFYEQEIAGFFSQFGTIWKVKVCRTTDTGRSQGYGFVEFKHPEVARVAAHAMNGHILAEEILRCQVCSQEWVLERPALFKDWDKKLKPTKTSDKKSRSMLRARLTESKYCELLSQLIQEDEQIRSNIEMQGINYQYKPFSSLISSDNIYHTWLRNGKILPTDGEGGAGRNLGDLAGAEQPDGGSKGGQMLVAGEGGEACTSKDGQTGATEVEFHVGSPPPVKDKRKRKRGKKKPEVGDGQTGATEAEFHVGSPPPVKKKKRKKSGKKKPEVGAMGGGDGGGGGGGEQESAGGGDEQEPGNAKKVKGKRNGKGDVKNSKKKGKQAVDTLKGDPASGGQSGKSGGKKKGKKKAGRGKGSAE